MTLDALKIAQDSLASKNIKILSADTANPGIPPSSMMAFMRKVQYIFQVNRWKDNSNVYSDFETESNALHLLHLRLIMNINRRSILM